jgi:hypothetical protein
MTARRNIMRKFRITEISGVDSPCQAPARAVIFKRASPAPEPVLEPAQAREAGDWSKSRETALQALQKLAEDRAAANGETVPTAYAAIMDTPEGAELYQRASW